MLKPRITEYLCATLLFSLGGSALAQPVLGQIIEQTKKAKLKEAQSPKPVQTAVPNMAGLPPLPPMPPMPVAVQRSPGTAPQAAVPAVPVAGPMITEPKAPEPPMVWSISGVNQQLIAELWDQRTVHRVLAVPGQTLPGGWKLVQASANSLTIKLDDDTRTLYPPALGTTGGEFGPIKRLIAESAPTGGQGGGPRDARSAGLSPAISNLVLNSSPEAASPAPLPPVSPGAPGSAGAASSNAPAAAGPREAAGNLPTTNR